MMGATVISLLKAYWLGEYITIDTVSRQFGVSKIDARLALDELDNEEVVIEIQDGMYALDECDEERVFELLDDEFH